MKLILVASAALAIVASEPAFAQSVTGTNASTSQSGSNSSISRHGDRVNSTTAIAPGGNSTAPCVLFNSTGVGVAGVGFSQGFSRVDKACVTRLEAQMLTEIAGLRGAARTAAIVHLSSNDEGLRRTMIAIGWLVKATP